VRDFHRHEEEEEEEEYFSPYVFRQETGRQKILY
jgi:hypothetical protein